MVVKKGVFLRKIEFCNNKSQGHRGQEAYQQIIWLKKGKRQRDSL